jgi:CDP-diacylglycerol--serine O-phosphatidyltransferase
MVEILKNSTSNSLIYMIPLCMVLMSAYRLAKFNTDERQTSSFIGLPTPANALLWLSIPLLQYLAVEKIHLWGLYNEQMYLSFVNVLTNPYFICIGSVFMAILLVSEVPMFSLKFKNFTWKENKIKFSFLLLSIALLFVFNCFAIPLIVLAYILVSIITNLIKK